MQLIHGVNVLADTVVLIILEPSAEQNDCVSKNIDAMDQLHLADLAFEKNAFGDSLFQLKDRRALLSINLELLTICSHYLHPPRGHVSAHGIITPITGSLAIHGTKGLSAAATTKNALCELPILQ